MFVLAIAVLAALSILDTLIGYRYLGLDGIANFWLDGAGFDFFDYLSLRPYLHTAQFFTAIGDLPWVYPAPAILVLYPFYRLTTPTNWLADLITFLVVSFCCDLALAWGLVRALKNRGLSIGPALRLVGVTIFLGWPIYFALQRGNIESLVWVGVALGVYCFAIRRYTQAALLLGVVGSVKLYPLVLLALFLRRRQLRYIALAAAVAVLTTLTGLRFLEPNIRDAFGKVQLGIQVWTNITLGWSAGVAWDHSLLGLLRVCTRGAVLHRPHALSVYLVLAGVSTATVFLVRVRRLSTVNQVMYLVCGAVLVPPTSYDYTLLLLLIPWAWMVLVCVEAAQRGSDLRAFQLPMLLFGVALGPLSFLHRYNEARFAFGGPVRSVALLALLVVAAWRPFGEIATQQVRGIAPLAPAKS